MAALPVQLRAIVRRPQLALLVANPFVLLAGLNGVLEHGVALHHRGVLGRVVVAGLQLPVVLIWLHARLVANQGGIGVGPPALRGAPGGAVIVCRCH